MKVLVTGGSGFIGSHLVESLRHHGHAVVSLDKATPRSMAFEGVEYVRGNVLDLELVRSIIDQVDRIFHLAAIIGIRRSMKRPLDTLTTNVLGTRNVLHAAFQKAVPVVLSSSSVVYGRSPNVPLSEQDDIVFGNLHIRSWTYSHAKLAEEAFAIAYYEQAGLPVKVFRLFNCIGPGQSDRLGNVLPCFVEAALAQRPLVVHGNGRQSRAFLDVRDAVKAILLVSEHGIEGEIYNVCGEREISIQDLAQLVIRLSGSDSAIQFASFAEVFGEHYEEPGRRIGDGSKLRSLGFSEVYSLEDTIRDCLNSARVGAGNDASNARFARSTRRRLAGVILHNGGKVLLQQRDVDRSIPWAGFWAIFGGHVENNEEPEAAARREVREELGLELFPTLDLVQTQVETTYERFIFVAALEVDPRELELEKGNAFELFSFAELANLEMVPADREVLVSTATVWSGLGK